VVHCTAGKDRAGFASAVMLRTLGVPEETVYEDFLLTNHYTAQKIERMLWTIRLFSLFRVDPEQVRPALGVERGYLQARSRDHRAGVPSTPTAAMRWSTTPPAAFRDLALSALQIASASFTKVPLQDGAEPLLSGADVDAGSPSTTSGRRSGPPRRPRARARARAPLRCAWPNAAPAEPGAHT
jgi:hypothetical protein